MSEETINTSLLVDKYIILIKSQYQNSPITGAANASTVGALSGILKSLLRPDGEPFSATREDIIKYLEDKLKK